MMVPEPVSSDRRMIPAALSAGRIELRVPQPGEGCSKGEPALFPDLSADENAAVGALVSRHSYARGRTVIYEGDAAEHIYHLERGVVRLTKLLADGRRQVTGFRFPGDFLGLPHCPTYPYSAEAIGQVSVHRFERCALETMSDRVPGVARLLLIRASRELVRAQAQLLLLGRRSPLEKLAYFLLRLRERLASAEDGSDILHLPMGRADIADFLGMTVETLSRTFTCMRREGLIALPDPQTVVFTDEDAVEEMAA